MKPFRIACLLSLVLFSAGCDLLDRFKSRQEVHLRIETTPTGAVVSVNGVECGEAPVTVSTLSPGRHLVKAQREGFHEARQTVALVAGERKVVTLELQELAGLVLVQSNPRDADITLDGSFRGKTPLMIPDFPSGAHRLRVAKPGYFAKDVEVTVRDRVPQLVSLDLTSDAATLSVNSQPPGALVLVNGSNRGTTPCRIDALPSGEVQLEVRAEGYAPFRQTVKLSAGQAFQVDAPLTAQPGSLQVVTTPEKAKVYVDNQLRGESPILLEGLSPGEHRVRIELKGYENDARSVKVKAGGRVTEEFRLTQNSGVLVLVTEPGGVRVLIDGEEQGETKPAPAGAVSTSFEVRYLAPGEHTLQLVRPGWTYPPKKFVIESGKAATLHEKMARLFIPDIRVRTPDEIITGVLLREYASGDLEIERSPGVILRIKEGDILERKPLKQGEK